MKTYSRAVFVWLLLAFLSNPCASQAQEVGVTSLDTVGMTVSDLDRSVEFYSTVLSMEKVSEVEVWGSEYEHLQGVFGLRMKVARLRLGDEHIELTEYLTPKGRPIPAVLTNLLNRLQSLCLWRGSDCAPSLPKTALIPFSQMV